MGRMLKLLAGMVAAIVGGVIGDLLYAQRDAEHPQGEVIAALTPAQILPCFLMVALAGRVTKGNLRAMLASGLLAGIVTSLAYGAEAKASMASRMGRKGDEGKEEM
jgi:fluoride ion exporter CrcB/FEX